MRAAADRAATKVGVAGAAVMATTFGMARYAYGLTLPDIRVELGVSDLLLGLIASGTFIGFLVALVASRPLASWRGARAPTTLGGACGTLGCAVVTVAPSAATLAAGALVAGSAAGWVWAPYSDIVSAVAAERDRPRLLAWITTGASAGLLLVGPLALAAAACGSWRWTWAGVAAVSAVATVLNVRWVPRVRTPRKSRHPSTVPARDIVRPLVFAVVFFAAATAYFTYAADVARRGGLGAAAGPAVFLLVGATGLAGLGAGRLSDAARPRRVAVGALVTVGAALAVLGLGSDSPVAVISSALIFGVGNMVGSAALPIWTAQLVPRQPASAFTVTLVVGSLSSIGTPALIGGLTAHIGLAAVLLATATVSVAAGLVLAPAGRADRRRER